MIKQLKWESTVERHLLLIKLKYPNDLHFNISSESNVLHSERCWQTVDVTSKQYVNVTQMFLRLA